MKTRRRNVTVDRLTISTQHSTRSKTSRNEVENSIPTIPVDLIIEILSRLPVKSVATCRCVSKLWGYVIGHQYFTELFLTRSLHRPRLLFSCMKDDKTFFFSSPQLQNPAETSSASSLMNFSFFTHSSHPIHGLICLTHVQFVKEREEKVISICNPSTGQSLNLPKLIFSSTVKCFLVYEPIKKQFKVLLLNAGGEYHQVLTLGTGELSWRKIEFSMPPFYRLSGICIKGVLYYPAISLSPMNYIIVCFDVSSEKFSFITGMKDFTKAASFGTLINYNGRLASLVYKKREDIELWILQDAEKQLWSKHTYVVPAWFKDMVETVALRLLGVTRTNEIMLAQRHITVPFYLFYFNIEIKTMRRVAIHGMEAFQGHEVFTYSDHVENVKLMDHMF